jgi:hypothetical protein
MYATVYIMTLYQSATNIFDKKYPKIYEEDPSKLICLVEIDT